MSAFADDPGHFARWLSRQTEAPEWRANSVSLCLARPLWLLSREPGRRTFVRSGRAACVDGVAHTARGVTVNASGLEIALNDGPPLRVDLAILACGHESVVDEGPLYTTLGPNQSARALHATRRFWFWEPD